MTNAFPLRIRLQPRALEEFRDSEEGSWEDAGRRAAHALHVGEIDGNWCVYHRVPDPFGKFGTRRVVDAWCGSQRLAEAVRREILAEEEVQP